MINRYLQSFKRGEIDFETMLINLAIKLEEAINDIVNKANLKDEIIQKSSIGKDNNIKYPILEYSIIPDIDPMMTPLERQAKLISAIIEIENIKKHIFRYVLDKQVTPPIVLDITKVEYDRRTG